MDVNTNYNILESIYLENIENYVVISEEMYKTVIKNINMNYLLILFTMSCLSTILLCPRKKTIQNKYILIKKNSAILSIKFFNLKTKIIQYLNFIKQKLWRKKNI